MWKFIFSELKVMVWALVNLGFRISKQGQGAIHKPYWQAKERELPKYQWYYIYISKLILQTCQRRGGGQKSSKVCQRSLFMNTGFKKK